jgi:CubicO group peptidase (beta-lactamase class C family)
MRPIRSRLVPLLAIAVLLLAPAAPAFAKGPLDQAAKDKIHAFASSAFDELAIPGAAVAVVDASGVVYEEGFGTTDDAGTPVTPKTPFHLASLSKQLTAIAVMQLIESGDLALDATVHSYLPWFGAQGSDTARITVKDLLAHTSGYSEAAGLTNRSDDGTDAGALERNIRRLATVPLSHPIGQFEYSNANYDALGYLVAVASGMSFEGYMAKHVFAPLGMVDSFTTEAAAAADGVAQGHYPFFGVSIKFPVGFVRGSVPSAFMASSAEDLGRVLTAHLSDGAAGGSSALSAAGWQGLRQPLVNPDPWDGYGWGWWTTPAWDAGTLVGSPNITGYDVPIMLEHTGSHSTYATGTILLPEAGYGVVVLMNRNDEAAESRFYQIHTGIASILLGRDAPIWARAARHCRSRDGGWGLVGVAHPSPLAPGSRFQTPRMARDRAPPGPAAGPRHRRHRRCVGTRAGPQPPGRDRLPRGDAPGARCRAGDRPDRDPRRRLGPGPDRAQRLGAPWSRRVSPRPAPGRRSPCRSARAGASPSNRCRRSSTR